MANGVARGSRIDRIKSTLTEAQAEALCRQWLPKGRRKGRAWVCCSPFRAENTPSFYVYLTPKIGFYDYGAGHSGDMINLCCRLFNVSTRDALEAFEQMLGLQV
jgi:hypothetical protein